jgi:hypothetical protein
VYKYRVPLQAGRYLRFPADSVGLAVSMKHTIIQYKQADRSLGEMEVDLLLPGTSRSVVHLMEAWWDTKVSILQQGSGGLDFAANKVVLQTKVKGQCHYLI